MSDPVSALDGAEFHGIASVADAGLTGMITLRGNLGAAKIKKAVKAATGTAVPPVGAVLASDATATAWMSPDELLLIVPHAEVADAGLTGMITLRGNLGAAKVKKAVKAATGTAVPPVGEVLASDSTATAWMSPDELLLIVPHAEVAERLKKAQTALEGEHAMAVDVSEARAVLTVTGPAAREVLAKLCPVDLSPAVFGKGDFRRTRMAQIPTALWMTGDDQFTVICFRSVAEYAFGVVKVAAQPGSGVGYF